MIRVVQLSGKYFGYDMNADSIGNLSDEERDNIDIFISEGTPVILVNDLEDLRSIGIHTSDVKMVENEEIDE